MTLGTPIRIAVAAALAVFLSAAPGGEARAASDCGAFPRIALWDELDHDFVRRHVDERYGGDWDAYLAKLERYEASLRDIHDRGLRAGVTWGDRKIRLKGDGLANFLTLVDQRLAVTRCLAEADGIADFSTAAGGTGDDLVAETAVAPRCGSMPDVDWWKFKSHEDIIDYVAARYGNDWDAYIDKWRIRLTKLKDIYDRGSSAVTSTGKVLQGRELFGYLEDMRQRISVTRCLAKARPSTKA